MNNEFDELLKRGDEAFNNGDGDKTIEYFLKAYEIDPTNQYLLEMLSEAYFALQDYDKSFQFAVEGIKLHPDSSILTLLIGLGFITHGEDHKAIEPLSTAIELDKKCGRAYHARGNCYLKAEEYEAALSDFSDAWSYLGETVENLPYLIGLCHERLGNSKEADKYYEIYQNLQKSPEAAEAIARSREIGEMADRFGNDQASEYFDQLMIKGDEAYQQQDGQKALEYYEQAYEMEPSNKYAIRSLTAVYNNIGNFEKTIEIADKGIALYPDEIIYPFNAGIAALSMNKFDLALAYLTKAISLEPDNAVAYYLKGECSFLKEEFNNALISYKKSLELGFDHDILAEKIDQCIKQVEEKD